MDFMKINVSDFEAFAKKNLDSSIFDFFYGGASNEVTLKENETSFDSIKLIPRILRGITDPDTTATIFGQSVSSPIVIAPMAFQKLGHPKGEQATARGAKLANVIMTASLYSTTSLKEIITESLLKPWFQLYILKDRNLTKEIIKLAESLECQALVLTVDAPVYGKRERELRNPLTMNIELPDVLEVSKQLAFKIKLSQAKQLSSFLEPALSWHDIAWSRSVTKMPIILKGVLRADDAKTALEHGVNGIIVSNHGGRQLDSTPATIYMLPKIAEAIDGKIDIFMDGGIRRGTDIIKALAFGAKAVLIGRPIIWGLITEGETGVHKVLSILHQELKLAMVLCGCKTIKEITSDLILNNLHARGI